jgi:hypothetical protein
MINGPVHATPEQLRAASWRKSSYSNDQGECVETAQLTDGTVAVRNSNHPQVGVVFFTPAEMNAWIKDCKAGEFDDSA